MTINIEYEAEKKLDIPYEEIITKVVEESMDYEDCPYEAEVNVLITDNQEIRQINREFRSIDNPTDVLPLQKQRNISMSRRPDWNEVQPEKAWKQHRC